MKKFTVKAVAVALASVCGSAAFAGSITTPATVTTYAVEGLTSATAITLPTVTYKMGVGRPVGNGFTIILTPSSGSTFSGTCPVPTYTGASTVGITVKRQSSSECAYDVTVAAAAVAVNDTFAVAALPLASHPLATAGSSVAVSVALKDPGETAFIDNTGSITKTVANSAQALAITATADTATIADVNNTNGPLRGFIAGGAGIADTASVAKASFAINNNPNSYVTPDGVTVWDFNNVGNGTSLAVTVAGVFDGLATNGVTVVGAGAPTVTVGTSSATFTITRANVVAAPGSTTVEVDMAASGNTSLGTSRTFGVSANATVVVGAAETLTGNASWWTWSANAIQLMSPYFSTDNNATVFSRFFFLNTGTSSASYTASCKGENGVTVTQNPAGTGSHTGTLNVGTTWIKSSDICSFSSGIRGSIVFTINAPASNIKGTYNNAINGSSSASLPLDRPYSGSTY